MSPKDSKSAKRSKSPKGGKPKESADEQGSLLDAIEKKRGAAPAAASADAGGEEATESILSKQIQLTGPSLKQIAIFCRQLATLLHVGISLQRALQILGQRTHHPQLRDVIGQVSQSIDEGSTFSGALEKHPEIFPPLIINVAKIGERGGILEKSMLRLADIMESKLLIRRKVIAASVYPAIVLTVAVPAFGEILEEASTQQGTTLPAITSFMLGLSGLLRGYWLILLIGAVLVVVGLWFYRKTPSGQQLLETIGYSIPKFRNLPVNINLARAMRSLGGLLEAGIPLLEAIQVTADSSESMRMRDALNRVYNSLESGGKFETPLRDEEVVFPPLVTDMIAVGEEAGALDTMLLSIADNADSEVETGLETLQSTIEPVLILLMGISVLFVFLALFLPYFQMISAAG